MNDRVGPRRFPPARLEEALSERVAAIKKAGIYFRLLEENLGPKAVEIIRAPRD